MTEAELPARLIRFLQSAVPTYPAAVLLVLLARDPARDWSVEELAGEPAGAALPPAALAEALVQFEAAGLLRRDGGGRYRFEPASAELRAAVAELVEAYDHRPVTLVRTIYSIATAKIQSFADSFRLKGD